MSISSRKISSSARRQFSIFSVRVVVLFQVVTIIQSRNIVPSEAFVPHSSSAWKSSWSNRHARRHGVCNTPATTTRRQHYYHRHHDNIPAREGQIGRIDFFSKQWQGLKLKFPTRIRNEGKWKLLFYVLAVVVCVLGKSSSAGAAAIFKPKAATTAASIAATESLLPPPLGLRHLVAASSLIALLGGVGLSWLGLRSIARQLMVACARCTLQLQLLGGLILQWLLPTSQPWLIMAWILGVGAIAAQEAYGRLDYFYPALRRHLTISFLLGGISVLSYAVAFQIFGKLQPWYQPQTLIPVAGMLFGNTLSAVTLGASSLTRSFVTNQDQVELWLSRGATYQEAVFPLREESIKTALTPTINALSVTGIVHLPGMMTGQILAGNSPRQAALYQTLIWFLIASVATATVQLQSMFITSSLVDKRHHRLRLESLAAVEKKAMKARLVDEEQLTRKQTWGVETDAEVLPITITATPLSAGQSSRSSTTTRQHPKTPALQVRNLHVARANIELSMDLHHGDRVGITGSSGIGKSQILRTLVGLEATGTKAKSHDATSDDGIADNEIKLHGISMSDFSYPDWRTRICLVSQSRPSVRGTPRDLYNQIRQFRYQALREPYYSDIGVVVNGDRKKSPMEIASKEWNLPETVFDRPWSTLSGGEASRAALAISISLKPQILLLDEISSALDYDTTILVENTLKRVGIPIIMVTHDRQQLERFCTHHIDLPSSPARPANSSAIAMVDTQASSTSSENTNT